MEFPTGCVYRLRILNLNKAVQLVDRQVDGCLYVCVYKVCVNVYKNVWVQRLAATYAGGVNCPVGLSADLARLFVHNGGIASRMAE